MKIHIIGIGGIGVSSLAQYYLAQGYKISGSDLAESEITQALAAKGIKILLGNKAGHIRSDFDLVVHSPAVKPDNPELRQAKSYGLKAISYPEALGELTKKYYTIAVSGSHGKTTTAAMVTLLLIKAGLDPTMVGGIKSKHFGDSNFRIGKSKYLVIEACEYDSSFNNYFPKITVVTNVDKEHLDYFKTFGNVIKTFKKFILQLPADGFLVFNSDDVNLRKISRQKAAKFSAVPYSLRQKEARNLKKIMQIPGQHNISNALAVLAVARILGISDEVTFASLGKYRGSWRRFEIFNKKINGKSYTLVSDYGHHPSEVMATLKAAREKYQKQKIWCVFQPHQHQRTYYLFDDFAALFRNVPVDNIIITDIYDVAGREEKSINQKINSQALVKKIARKHVRYLSLADAEKFVKENIKAGDVLVVMGAGDIYKMVDNF